jgi:hypothetical protein
MTRLPSLSLVVMEWMDPVLTINSTLGRIWLHLMLLLLPLLASYILYASTATPYVKGKTEKAWKVLESFTYYHP